MSIPKDIFLDDELRTAHKLIEVGLGEYQNQREIGDFYHLHFQLLSSGIERFMKCYICLGYHEDNNVYPSFSFLKNCGGSSGHDLISLKNYILTYYFKTNDIPVLEEDLELLTNNTRLYRILYFLSEFGKYARYYNLDVITDNKKPSIDVETEWKNFENTVLKSNSFLYSKIGQIEHTEAIFDFIIREIIILIEKFIRALSRQFTIGGLGQKASQWGGVFYDFIVIQNSNLGNKDYRIKTTRYKKTEKKVHKRTKADEIQRKFNPKYKSKLIKKSEYPGDWPFYNDEVIIECRDRHWCIVTIENKDYALNGAAQGRYKIEDVHTAGMAILGKSTHEFIQMALNLFDENRK